MFVTILILASILIGIAFLGLGVKIFFTKEKKFPETRIGHSRMLQKKGIYCAITEQRRVDRNFKVKAKDLGCASCNS
ncbi:MAG: hypothetical protein U9N85_06950 [Bacteroidota bacterium]|nr:hypothetical protein [Bacteroidota bacterium]